MDLTPLESQVLLVLSESRLTQSAVTVAMDMADRDPKRWRFGDPVGLAAFVLAGLNERGLITYAMREKGSHSLDESGNAAGYWPSDLPYRIRLTSEGWAEAGYPVRTGVVGTSSRHGIPPRHPGDRTDYRTHHSSSEGSHPVERLPFWVHMDKYPGHTFHLNGGPFMGNASTEVDDDMTRPYTKVTADMEAATILYRADHPTASYAEIGEVVGIPERTAKYILTTRARQRGLMNPEDSESLRTRMLRVITDFGPLADVFALRTMLATGEDPHNITHVLNSLQKAGEITFKTRQRGSVTRYENIRARTKSEKAKDAEVQTVADEPAMSSHPDTQNHASASGEDVTVVEAIESQDPEPTTTEDLDGPESPGEDILPTPEPVTASPDPGDAADWPELRGLIEAEQARVDAESKVAVYERAAEAIAALGDNLEAERLITKAASIAPPMASRIEAEYLAFATSVMREGRGWPKR